MRRGLGLLGAVAVLAVAGCGDDEGRDPVAPAATTAPAPAASGTALPGDFTPLEGGTTYTTRAFRPAVSVTPSKGRAWTTEVGDTAGHFAVALDADLPIKQAIIELHRVTRVYDPRRGGVIPGDMIPFEGDFAAWLEDHPHLRTSGRREVRLMGLDGVQLDVGTTSSPPRLPADCGKVGRNCVPLLHDGLDSLLASSFGRGRFVVLELDGGGQLVVEQYAEPASRFREILEVLRPTLQSLELAR